MTIRRSTSKPAYTRMPHRCIKCGHRKTLSRLWSLYDRKPKCEVCGYRRLTPCRDRLPGRWGRKYKCGCSGYWFIHRKGSKYCDHNPNAERHWTERGEA